MADWLLPDYVRLVAGICWLLGAGLSLLAFLLERWRW